MNRVTIRNRLKAAIAALDRWDIQAADQNAQVASDALAERNRRDRELRLAAELDKEAIRMHYERVLAEARQVGVYSESEY